MLSGSLGMQTSAPRRSLYAPIFSRGISGLCPPSKIRLIFIVSIARRVLIGRMPKPEEVLIVEEEGEIIREVAKDTDSIILYKSMRQTLIYLTNLDPLDTQQIMLEKLTNQVT